MPDRLAIYVIAACMLILAGDALYIRFVQRGIQTVYVFGGSINADLNSPIEIDSSTRSISVYVDGGKLDLPTDTDGRLYVVPMKDKCVGLFC